VYKIRLLFFLELSNYYQILEMSENMFLETRQFYFYVSLQKRSRKTVSNELVQENVFFIRKKKILYSLITNTFGTV